MSAVVTRTPRMSLSRSRLTLAMAVALMTCLELIIAARTIGTDDMLRWMEFAAGVAEVGPVDIYVLRFGSQYNHPPLIGYMLQGVNASVRLGVAFPFAIRLPAIAAGAVTPFLVFELLRSRRGLHLASVSAISVALSPALFAISGFHGNTDPVVVMLSLLSVYLLVDRRTPALAGVAIALALGVKIVPLVMVPVLLWCALSAGWRSGLRFILAGVTVSVITWGPAASSAWEQILSNVLGYGGGRQAWGLTQVGRWLGDPAWVDWFVGPGRVLGVLIAAGVPVGLAMRRPHLMMEASALALTGLLALSPGIGLQYVAWAIAPSYLLADRSAAYFNVLASVTVLIVYTGWSGGLPWYLAASTWFTPSQMVLAFATWIALLVVHASGIQHFGSGHPIA